MIGLFDTERRIHGMAGFSGLGNSFSNVGAAYIAARIAGAPAELEQRHADTLELLMALERESAHWPGGEPTLARADSLGVVRTTPTTRRR